MKFVLVFVGAVLGGLFMDAKLTTHVKHTDKTEIVYGTRVNGFGQLMLVTK